MVAHAAHRFAVQGYMDRFTYLLMVAIRYTIVPIVREALKLMRLCFSVLVFSSASFRYSAHLFLGVGNSKIMSWQSTRVKRIS